MKNLRNILYAGFVLFVCLPYVGHSQTKEAQSLGSINRSEMEFHLRFLASDELKGRKTGEEGNNIAARYIANYFQANGLEKAPGLDSYFQGIPFERRIVPTTGTLRIKDIRLSQGQDLMVLYGNAIDKEAEIIYAGQGWVNSESGHDDYKGLDVKGKIVLVSMGTPDGNDMRTVFNAMALKRQIAADKGAIALLELYKLGIPWKFVQRRMGQPGLQIAEKQSQSLVYGWVNDSENSLEPMFQGKETLKASLATPGSEHEAVSSQNVIGIVKGSDPQLTEEYLLLTAHYDHVGTGPSGGRVTPEDSIFNGARDNAIGTVAIMLAAKSLAMNPPKRSVIVMAVTGEEMGLLGSKYYANNPLVPLNKTIFNLNIDGGGYNDTSMVAIMGYKRVGAMEEMGQAAAAFGLGVIADPAPEQNLFDRSDNVSFAAKGIPSPTFSTGMTSFNEEILKYYHQVNDEAESLNFSYLLKYCKAYAMAARLIANKNKAPKWIQGDKYEPAAKALYGYD